MVRTAHWLNFTIHHWSVSFCICKSFSFLQNVFEKKRSLFSLETLPLTFQNVMVYKVAEISLARNLKPVGEKVVEMTEHYVLDRTLGCF